MNNEETEWGPEQDAEVEAIPAARPNPSDDLTAQVTSLNDKYLRLMAEFENYKRRSARDHERIIETANEQLIKEIIEVKENFERAFKSNAKGDKFVEGMKLNYVKLKSILKKYGLEAYAERGDKFTPELHDAVMCAPHQSIADSHISDVLERGYSLKGKIIKHAKVVVSSGRPKGKRHPFQQAGPSA